MKSLLSSGNLIKATGIWLAVSTGVVVFIALVAAQPNTRAVILMGAGLVLFWIILGGLAMWSFRDAIRNLVLSIRIDWRIKFVLLATCLALIEEAITTAMTNLAPWFGVPIGAAYITASSNYLDVVCFHSVVVFVPMFAGWAFLLQRYDFSPGAVFLLFGLTGVTVETVFGGWQALVEFCLWIFVYGLMVYLPAYTIPSGRGTRPPRGWHYVLAVVTPVIFAVPVAALVGIVHPVKVHFPLIAPNS